jgi:hypothetical protein
MGDPDMPHTSTFIPDIGVNLVRLGERDDALARVWHLPSRKTRTTRDGVALVYNAAGTEPRLKVTSAWQTCALGLVNSTVREINEMRYEFDESFRSTRPAPKPFRPARHAPHRRRRPNRALVPR